MRRFYPCQAGCGRSVDFTTQYCLKCEERIEEGFSVADDPDAFDDDYPGPDEPDYPPWDGPS